ncbi:MAG: hypothetical protein ACOYT9_00915 [Patescibacteria group bacterium]
MLNALIIIIVLLTFAYLISQVIQKSGVSSNTGVSPNKGGVTEEKYIEFHFDDSDKTEGEYLVADIETTGLPIKRKAKPEDFDNWPYIVQIGWLLFDNEGKCIELKHYVINQNIDIPKDSVAIHGITNEIAKEKGVSPKIAYTDFVNAIK